MVGDDAFYQFRHLLRFRKEIHRLLVRIPAHRPGAESMKYEGVFKMDLSRVSNYRSILVNVEFLQNRGYKTVAQKV